jgi:hypothetical protein
MAEQLPPPPVPPEAPGTIVAGMHFCCDFNREGMI